MAEGNPYDDFATAQEAAVRARETYEKAHQDHQAAIARLNAAGEGERAAAQTAVDQAKAQLDTAIQANDAAMTNLDKARVARDAAEAARVAQERADRETAERHAAEEARRNAAAEATRDAEAAAQGYVPVWAGEVAGVMESEFLAQISQPLSRRYDAFMQGGNKIISDRMRANLAYHGVTDEESYHDVAMDDPEKAREILAEMAGLKIHGEKRHAAHHVPASKLSKIFIDLHGSSKNNNEDQELNQGHEAAVCLS